MNRLKAALKEDTTAQSPIIDALVSLGFKRQDAPAELRHFQNNDATAVFDATGKEATRLSIGILLDILRLKAREGSDAYPDEVSIEPYQGKKYLRLWWD